MIENHFQPRRRSRRAPWCCVPACPTRPRQRWRHEVCPLVDAVHAFADIDKLARVVPVDEIAANGHNLNISRYVQTGADAEEVDVAAEVVKLQDLIANRNEAEAVMFGHLKRLGYVE